MIQRIFVRIVIVTILAATAIRASADDVVQKLPSDALAFVVLNNLDQTDAKVAQLLETLNAPYPTPATFFAAVTGIQKEIDRQGDLLLAVLPAGDNAPEEIQYCVWLPVADYDAMLTALDASRGEVISGIVVADEDLLIAKHGDHALVMDPGARDRMEQILESKPAPPKLSAGWNEWINANDIAIVALPGGTRIGRALLKASATKTVAEFIADNATDDGDAEDEIRIEYLGPTLASISKWLADKRELRALLDTIATVGVAARIDDQGNALASARLVPGPMDHGSFAISDEGTLPPSLFKSGEFLISGAGHFPMSVVKTLSATYARSVLHELRDVEQVDVDPKTAQQFLETFQAAAEDVVSWDIAKPLGEKTDGLYTDYLLAVRVADSTKFVEHAADVVEQWNRMHRDAETGTQMVFDIEETKVGQRGATQYSLDVAKLDGMPAIPEIRQAMEKFFGTGGKMRAWVVRVDDHTVLLAAGSDKQVAAAVELLDRKQQVDWKQPAFADANSLLRAEATSRVFLSPRGQSEWNRRQMEAMSGAVLGGKRHDFPESPPIGFSMQFGDGELTIDAAVPRATIEAAGSATKNDRPK